ncbi:DUF262 domain-containing protein [Adlercreutzia sp. ZJ141]|uniref:DUF262 domain-containing protein n=1 Tax=Adlercreutzia sp. ZJ141 TaxID=2709406 RepID=UPI0013EBD2E9|nr:DUF262 domain-containing protein [Adlercreutzia sp. ZJ141]
MIKNVSDPSIASILSTDALKVYTIPRYQREYTWGQRDWANLYDDVFNNDSGYFLGSIIVIQGEIDPKTNIVDFEVIDGQQRLTTISLLLAAIYARINEHANAIDEDMQLDDVRPLRNRLILKSNKGMTRVVPQVQNHNQDDYRWILKEHAGLAVVMQRPKYHGVRKMSKSFEYFYDRLGEEIAGMCDDKAVRVLLDKNRLLCSAVLVQINVDSHADAYTLFASLNNRGVPLSAVDLIKNTLLAKVADADGAELDYYFEQWQEVLRNLGEDYATQERFFRQNYDAFRRGANRPFVQEGGAQLPLGSVATRSNLLKIYEKRIGQDPGALGVLDELLCNSAIYSQIIGVEREDIDDELERQFVEIGRAQGVPSYLMLLYLMKRETELGLDSGLIARIVALLVKFFVRRNVTDTPPTRDLERLFISICEGIEDEQLKGIDVASYIKRRLVDVSANDITFKECLEGSIYDVNPDMTRYILAILAEPSVTKEMKGLWERYPSGNYVWTIEHVFPQGENIPASWVEMIGGGDKLRAQEIQATHVHTLGNLTITGYNSKLSNMPFMEKRDRKDSNGANVGYRNGLNLNDDLVSVDNWTKEQIEARTEKLVVLALRAFTFGDIEF